VTFHRREVLGTLGVASASTLLWALGCGAPRPGPSRAPQVRGEVRTWLHDAVARLATRYPDVHALAVSRRRTAAAVVVLGAGVARLRRDGVVLTVRDRDGSWREHVTSELTAAGVDAAVQALDAPRDRASVDFGRAPSSPDEPLALDDQELRRRADQLLAIEPGQASRIVYAAALLEVDDAIVWSVAPGRDLEQRLVRLRQSATRAAWTAARPVVREVEHAWSGWLDDRPITPAELAATSEAVLELMTPGAFDDGDRTVVLEPSVVAILLDAVVRDFLTGQPAPHRDDAPRLPDGAVLASPLITLIDDPTAPGAYGGFAFDDQGGLASPITLVDAGRVAARLADRTGGAGAPRGRRPGHVARLEPSSSHLRLVPAAKPTTIASLYSDGFALEGGLAATLDPRTGRVRIACARARELRAGNPTGRVYADVDLVGSLTSLLSAVDAIAGAPSDLVISDLAERDPASRDPSGRAPAERNPRWRSISAPAIRTRGLVRARRSRT